MSILIAGAGAIGCTTAYVLARAGHRVTVADPAPDGPSASRVAAGMLAPVFESLFDEVAPGRYPLLVAARDLWPALAAEIALPLDRQGAAAIGDATQVEAWAAAARSAGAPTRTTDVLDQMGLFTPEDWRIDPSAALAALRAAAERCGARFETRRVSASDLPGFESLVIATGAGQELIALAPELARLSPIKGHILRADGDFSAAPVLRAAGLYLCRTPGEAILGATMEPGRADVEIDPAVVTRLLEAASELIGPLGRLSWHAAAGVRAATPDGLPLVGPSATPGVMLAVGARRNGWLLAPMIANAVLDGLEGRTTDQTSLFDPIRFSRG
jgi:glycine oxidase